MTTTRSPADLSGATHAELAELLMDCVLEERDHIAALDLDTMQEWTERRQALTIEVIALAEVEPIDEDSARIYERVHFIAHENQEILRGAHRSLKQLIDGLHRPPTSHYDTKGKVNRITASRPAMNWKG
jgi:hypothetical protein